jgi:predicted DNA-binding transcriptional regulator AlpA
MAQTVQQLPADGYVRLSQIIGDKDADPPIPAVIPVSKSTWYEGIKSGRFPKPIKLGPRIAVWRVGDIRALLCLLLCLCSILMYVPDSQAVGLFSCTDRCPPLRSGRWFSTIAQAKPLGTLPGASIGAGPPWLTC